MHQVIKRSILSSVMALLAAAAAAAPAQVATQLPRDVRPLHYSVFIEPHAEAMRFDGDVVIDIEVKNPVDNITLNAADLDIHGAVLEGWRHHGPVVAQRIDIDNEAQTASIHFSQRLPRGRYRLKLDYSGVIGNQATGLFALDYDTPQGHKRALYTQFENSDARRMIPSWDEPEYKASFVLQASIPQGQMAVSNMPISARKMLTDGRELVSFAASPKMSSYLLFFGLGEFERVSTTFEGTELGVITRKGVVGQAAFALDASKDILREYNDYFGMRYPLPKLDNIAGPGASEFFGAMENWGAIFTFERDMLLDPAIATPRDKESIFATEAHEMAHQWFGDLVTMHWWDDLWLNEGFASWMERRTTARLHPEWHVELGAVQGREAAMGRDAVVTTHPVVQHVDTVDQASQAFDSITYAKGEAVIRMLENYVGSDAWRQGVRTYMRAHAFGNTASDDLWREMDKATAKTTGAPVSAIAHDFTLQPGVPMIVVGEPVCHDGRTTVVLSQSEFSTDQPDKAALHWRVPVVAQIAGADPQQLQRVLVQGKATLELSGCGAVLVNAGQNGYYRTRYEGKNFAALTGKFAALPAIDQLGLLSDSWSLGLSGGQPMADFLDLAQAVPADADAQVWDNLADRFAYIHQQYRAEPARQARFDQFAIARLAPKLQQLGWDGHAGEADELVNLRSSLIGVLSILGDTPTIAEARRRYASRNDKSQTMPPALAEVVTAVVARHADAATWEGMRAEAKAEKSPLQKDRLYHLLALTEDRTLAQRTLELAVSDEAGATVGAGLIDGVARQHSELAFDFALTHLEQVERLVDASSRSRYFPRLASGSTEPATVPKLNAYAEAHLPASSRRDAETAVAHIRYQIRIRDERLPAIDAWLTTRHG